MPNFAQCHKCHLSFPIQYLSSVVGITPSGKAMRVKVCSACEKRIKEEQTKNG